MKSTQASKLEMFKAVQTYLDNQTAVWSTIPILTGLKNEFDNLLDDIDSTASDQESARVYMGKNKTTQKRVVAEKTDILNDALEAYAAIEGNAELEQKAAKTFSDLYKLRNLDFDTVVKETIRLLEQHLTDLAGYGVTAEQITDLKNSFDQFLSLQGKPRQFRIAEKQATTGLEDLFINTTELLNNKIDKLMTRFKRSNTNFYNGYLAARVIVDK